MTTTLDWLLAGDPSIRWQALRDLAGAPQDEWGPERVRVGHEGWGARLLSHQDPDGQWAGGAFLPAGFTGKDWKREGQPWTATCYALDHLREFGLDPDAEVARRTVVLVGQNARWDEGGQPFWDGEVEECINGRTVASGAYFGADVSGIVDRLLGERQPDGGWNCERANGSLRSSFDTTISVLEGLLEFERASGGSPGLAEARRHGEEFLLQRALFRRLATGEPADADYLSPVYPCRWHYDVLRGLDYFRAAGVLAGTGPDPRLGEAVGIVRGLRDADGTWHTDRTLRGRTWFDLDDGPGRPSPWLTLKALRVIAWFDAAAPAAG